MPKNRSWTIVLVPGFPDQHNKPEEFIMLIYMSVFVFVFIIKFPSFAIILRDSCGTGWDRHAYNLATTLEFCYKFVYEKNISKKFR